MTDFIIEEYSDEQLVSDAKRLVNVLGKEGRESKLLFLVQHMRQIRAAAFLKLSQRGITADPANLGNALTSTAIAFWRNREKYQPDEDWRSRFLMGSKDCGE